MPGRQVHCGSYVCLKQIGQGSTAKVFLACDQMDQFKPQQAILNDSVKPYAVKVEAFDEPRSQILTEIKNYKRLQGCGFPRLLKQEISYETESISFVFDLLGPSLENLLAFCGDKMSLKTTLMVFQQLLDRLEYMHRENLVHNDLKPANILLGLGADSNTLHLIDFGLTRSVIDASTGNHVPFTSGQKTDNSTSLYTSINQYKGNALSKRDDLISLGYIVHHLFLGHLHWQNPIDVETPIRDSTVAQIKEIIPNKIFCKGCPPQFAAYMDYVKGLDFDESPDFSFLTRLVVETAEQNNLDIFDQVFDWSLLLTKTDAKVEPCGDAPLAHSDLAWQERAKAYRFDHYHQVLFLNQQARCIEQERRSEGNNSIDEMLRFQNKNCPNFQQKDTLKKKNVNKKKKGQRRVKKEKRSKSEKEPKGEKAPAIQASQEAASIIQAVRQKNNIMIKPLRPESRACKIQQSRGQAQLNERIQKCATRLDSVKAVLNSGQHISQVKLTNQLGGETFEQRKQFYLELQAQLRIEIVRSEAEIFKSTAQGRSIFGPKSHSLGSEKRRFLSVAHLPDSFKPFGQLNFNSSAKGSSARSGSQYSQIRSDNLSQNQHKSLDSVPSEHSLGHGSADLASAYRPGNYQQGYKEGQMIKE